ncbi:hypothetical protein ACFPVT_09630 [Corynebacterium choanae]|uniref:Anti-sigma-D factor RsdA n=1 Tax=Corynebacterium choanae TaxID=1862358 RepID=A0A3G6JDL6_9CORY|nr:hypothetical protein [Corynebacterium choanae]AZA14244.1 Anti-sigma-D factor RsdA [Corynebacterium choanae]
MGEHRAGRHRGEPRQFGESTGLRPDTSSELDMEAVLADDLLLDALAAGQDPADGNDPVAGLLLALRDDVYRPQPPAPQLRTPLNTVGHDSADLAATTVLPQVSALPPAADTTDASEPTVAPDAPVAPVVSLRERAAAKTKRSVLGPGLIGAAAATLVIAGGGTVVHEATPGDPLWGLHQAMFGSHAAVVELSATLEEAENRNANGDVEGALQLLEQAREIAEQVNASKDAVKPQPQVTKTNEVTTTVTTTVEVPAEQEQVTKTVTVTPAVPVNPAQPVSPRPKPSTTPVEVPDYERPAPTTAVNDPIPTPTSAVAPPPGEQGAPVSESANPVDQPTTAVPAPSAAE